MEKHPAIKKNLKLIKVSPIFQNNLKHQHPKNKVLHQETFTIPPYQVKKAKILLAVHSILTYTTQRTKKKYVKLTNVLFPDTKIREQLELGRTKLGYLLHFCLASYCKEQHFSSLLPVTGFARKFVSPTKHLITSRSGNKWMFMFFTFMKRNNK